MRALAIGLLLAQTLSGGVIYDKDGRRIGTVRENTYGGFDLYDEKYRRQGYGRTSPYDPGVIELFDALGNRLGITRQNPGQRRK